MFRSIANTFANCFKIPELKSRILFTLGMLAAARSVAVVLSENKMIYEFGPDGDIFMAIGGGEHPVNDLSHAAIASGAGPELIPTNELACAPLAFSSEKNA